MPPTDLTATLEPQVSLARDLGPPLGGERLQGREASFSSVAAPPPTPREVEHALIEELVKEHATAVLASIHIDPEAVDSGGDLWAVSGVSRELVEALVWLQAERDVAIRERDASREECAALHAERLEVQEMRAALFAEHRAIEAERLDHAKECEGLTYRAELAEGYLELLDADIGVQVREAVRRGDGTVAQSLRLLAIEELHARRVRELHLAYQAKQRGCEEQHVADIRTIRDYLESKGIK
jgi:hypothetical protein